MPAAASGRGRVRGGAGAGGCLRGRCAMSAAWPSRLARGWRRCGPAGPPWRPGRRRSRRGWRRRARLRESRAAQAIRSLISAGRTGCAVTARPPARRPAVVAARRREGVVADAVAAGGLVVLGGDDAQVVDPGRRRRPGGVLRLGLGMGVPADLLRVGQAVGLAVPADLDDGQVERVEDALDAAAGQRRVGLVGAAEQLDGGVLADQAGARTTRTPPAAAPATASGNGAPGQPPVRSAAARSRRAAGVVDRLDTRR